MRLPPKHVAGPVLRRLLTGAIGFCAGYLFTPRDLPRRTESSLDDRKIDDLPGMNRIIDHAAFSSPTLLELTQWIGEETGQSVACDDKAGEDLRLAAPKLEMRRVTIAQILRTLQRLDPRLSFELEEHVLDVGLGYSSLSDDARAYPVDDLENNRALLNSLFPRGEPDSTLDHLVSETIPLHDMGLLDARQLSEEDGHLRVIQPKYVQDQIADLLEVLRRIADQQRATGQ
jgi:hypothetical protein